MNSLRGWIRLLALGCLTGLGTLLWLGGRAVMTAQARRLWRGWILQTWARVVLRLLGVRVQVQGARPASPFFLVANHLSYLDMVVLAAQGEAVFIAKQEIAAWPLVGWLSRQMNTLFIDRTRKRDLLRVNAKLAEHFAAGQSVVLFPEGTTTDGAGVLPFKSGLFEPVVNAGCSVATAGLSYHTGMTAAPAATAVCWWGEMEFVPHFWQLLCLPGCTAALVYGSAPLAATERKSLARQSHAAVTRLYCQARQLAASPVTTPRWWRTNLLEQSSSSESQSV